MDPGRCLRTVRAAVFAAVCVLLTALGHIVMSGTAVPRWALLAGAVGSGVVGWVLAGRERGFRTVLSATMAIQAVLHAGFSLAQVVAQGPSPDGGASLVERWTRYLLCMAPMPAEHGPAHHDMPGMTHDAATSLGHAAGGMPSLGMPAAHLLAALLCGLWLAHGERAAFRVLRACAGRLVAPLRWALRLPTPLHRPRVRARTAHAVRTLRQLLLVHVLTSRGPPSGTAVR
ncbi:hypothetical protein [Streptomyces sp. NPDC093109]|uniref:hypothetical protein n=1 Tax=Streptomyces sp. NPDC093109 TaxID=3154977 RepID=UPI0034502DF0